MKPMKWNITRLVSIALFAINFLFTSHQLVYAQVTGDYRTKGVATFGSSANWDIYDGTAWVQAMFPPYAQLLQTTTTRTTNGSVSNATAITLSTSNSNIMPGMYVYGTNIRTGTFVTAISGTALTMSQSTNGTVASSTNLTFGYTINSAATTNVNTLTLWGANPQLSRGMYLSGTGITNGTYITNIAGEAISLSQSLSVGAGTVLTAAWSFTQSSSAALTSGSYTVTVTDTNGVRVGALVTGTGIAGNTVVRAINSNTSITLSTRATTTGSTPLTFWAPSVSASQVANTNILVLGGSNPDFAVGQIVTGTGITNGSIIQQITNSYTPTVRTNATNSSAQSRITLTSTAGLAPGMAVTGTNVPAGTFIDSIVSTTVISINQNLNTTVDSAINLSFGSGGNWTALTLSLRASSTRVTNISVGFDSIPNLYINHDVTLDNNVATTIGNIWVNNAANAYPGGASGVTPTNARFGIGVTGYGCSLYAGTINVAANASIIQNTYSTGSNNTNTFYLSRGDGGNVITNNGTFDLFAKTSSGITNVSNVVFATTNLNQNAVTAVGGSAACAFNLINLNLGFAPSNVLDFQSAAGFTMATATTSNTLTLAYGTMKLSGGASSAVNITPFGTANSGTTSGTLSNNTYSGVSGLSVSAVSGNTLTVASTLGLCVGQYVTSAPNSNITNSGYYISSIGSGTIALSSYNPNAVALTTGNYSFSAGAAAGLLLNSQYVTVNAVNPNATSAAPTQTFIGFNLTITSNGGIVNWGTASTPVLLTPIMTGGAGQVNIAGGTMNVYGGYNMINNGGVTSISGNGVLNLPLTNSPVNTTNSFNGGTNTPFYTLSFGYNNYFFMSGGTINVSNHHTGNTPYNCDVFLTSTTGVWQMTGGTLNINANTANNITYFINRSLFNLTVQNGCSFIPATAAYTSNSINTLTVIGQLTVANASVFDAANQTVSVGANAISGTGTINTLAATPFTNASTFTGTVNYAGGTQTINGSTFNNLNISGTKSTTSLSSQIAVTASGKNYIDCSTQAITQIPVGTTIATTGTGSFPGNTYIVAVTPSTTGTATTTSGSTSVTMVTTGITPGMMVSGTGIAVGTYVTAVTGTSNITLSANATASGTNTLTFNATLYTSANATAAGALSTLSFSSTITLFNGNTNINGSLNVNYSGIAAFSAGSSNSVNLTGSVTGQCFISSPFGVQNITIAQGDTLVLDAALTANGIITNNGWIQLNTNGSSNKTVSYGVASGIIFNKSGYSLSGSTDNFWPSTNGPANITLLQPLTLNSQPRTIASARTLLLNTAFSSANNLTVNGNVQLNGSGSVTGAPVYNSGSTLIYNTGSTYNRASEWNNPANVTINNGTTLVLGTQTAALTIAGNLTVNGNLTLSTTASPNGDLNIQGNWWRSGSANITQNNNTLIFSGSGDATIGNSSNATETFYNLTINKSASGSITLSTPVQVSNTLNLTAGVVNTSGVGTLTLTNNAQAALLGSFDNTTHINGGFYRKLPQMGSGAYLFPVGVGGVYYPFSITNPTASNSTTTAMVQVSNSNSGGVQDNTTVSVLSTTEYWQLAPSGGNLTGGNVSVARTGIATSPNNLLTFATTLSGTYSSIGGTASGNNLNNTNSIASINSGNSGYFVLGLYSSTPTITSVTGGATATSAYIGQTITIVGANFTAGTTVSINGGAALSTTFISSTQIQLTIPPAATSGNMVANVGGTNTNSFAFNVLGYITKQSGDWSSAATWLGGLVPPTGVNTVLAHNTTLTNPGYNAISGTLTIQTGITLTFGSTDTLSFTTLINYGTIIMNAGGVVQLTGTAPTFTNNGSFVYGIGTLGLNGVLSNTINGQNSFYNVNVGGAAALCNDTIYGSLVVTGNGQYSCNPIGGAVTLPNMPLGQTVNIYAAPNGSGVGSGASFSLPVNLARARVVAQNYPNNPVNILLEDGTYFQLTLNSSDARTANAPAVYKAINKGKAIFQPLKVINRADFQSIPDTIKQRIIDNTAKGKVMQLDLTKYNINAQSVTPWATVVSNTPKYPIFYQNTTPLMLSRYPNDTTMSMNGVIYKGTNKTDSGGIFYYSDTRTNKWLNALNDEGVWFAGNWRVSFVLQYIKTKTIDTVNKIIYQKDGVQLGIGNKFAGYSGNNKEPYFVSNLFEEIDTVGEFSINFNNKMLYMWVPDTGTIQYSDSLTMPAISATGASYTQFQNLNFSGGAGNAMKVSSANNVRIAGCDFTQCTDDAIVLTDMNYSTVQSNDFHQIGSGGVAMFNTNYNSDINTLKRCYDTVINNFFYDYANQVPLYNAAIDLGQCIGVYVANNKLRKSPHIGIAYGFGAGDLSTLEYNEVDSVVLVYSDMGAIYGTGVWKDRGHKINHNYLHDIEGANGLYLDNNTSGDTCVYNIVANSVWGMGNNGGNYNRFFKNVFVNNERPAVGNYTADTIIDFVRNYPVIKNLWYSNPTWQTMFPELIDLVDSVNGVNKSYTSNYWSQMKNNVFYTFGSKFSGQTFTYVSDNSLFNADGTTNNTYARTSDPFTRWGMVFQDNLKVTNKLKNPIYPFVLDSLRTPGLLTAGGATDWHINRIGLYIDSFRTNLNNMGVQGIAPKIAITTNSNTNHIFPDTTILVATITNPNIANCISNLQFFDNGTLLTGLTIIPKQVSYDTVTYTANYTSGAIGSHNITCKITDEPYWQYESSSYNYTTDSAMTWTGNTSTDWNTASNWSNNRAPLTTDIVTIPGSVSRMPIITGGAKTVKRCSVKSGATLTIQNATDTLKVSGDVQSTGTFLGNGVLTLLSTSSTPISASQTWGTTVYYGANNQTVVDGYYSHLNLSGGNMTFSTLDTIFISGNLTLGISTLTTTNSTVAFNGTAAQSINKAIVFNNLVINKSGVVNPLNLGGATVVNGSLNLVSGRVVSTSANSFTVNSSSTIAIQGGSSTSYIDGPLSWNVANGSNNYVFPVGDYNVSSQYMPDTLTSVANAGTVTITAYKGNNGGTVNSSLTSISTNEYWSISSSVANTIAITITPPTLGTNNLIGQSSTINGVYASVGGVATNTSISAPNISLSANTISWLVAGYYPVPIISSVVSCIQNVPSGTFYPRDTLTITGNFIQSTTTITVGGLPVTVYPLLSNYPIMVKVLVPANVTSGTVKLGISTFNGTLNPGYVTRFDGKWNDGIANNPSLSSPNYSIWLGGSAPPKNVDTITISNAVTMANSVSGIQMLTINAGASFTTSNVGTTFNSGATILNNGTYTTGNNSSFNSLNFTNNGLFTATSSSSYNNSTIINNNKAILGGQSFTNVSFTNNLGDSVIIASASVTMSGIIINNGYFKHSSTAMYVNGSLTFTGNNVDTINSLTILAGTSGTITFTTPPYLTGNFALNSNYTVTGNYPTYAGNGNLYYNTGAPQTIGFEWKPNAASGSGIPVAVRIGNGTAGSSLSFSGTNSYRATGAITVSSGCSLTVPNGNSLQSNGLTIAGTVAINDGATIQTSATVTVTNSGIVNIGSSVLANPATTVVNAALIVTAGSVNDTGTVTNYGYIRLSGSNFNVLGNGSLSMQANSVLEAAYASPVIPTATWNANAYLYLTGITSAAPTNIAQSFGHVIWNSTTQTGDLSITGLNNIAGNFTVLNTGGHLVNLNNTANTYGNLQVGGTAVINGNTINATASNINIGYTTASTTTVNGNITIGNNGTLAAAMPADTLVLSGNWQNSGTFTSANTTVVFKGNAPQTITKTGGETFNNLVIANTGTGVWQNAAVTINGALTFTAGKLFLGDNHCTVSGSSVVNVSGLVTNSYAVINGTGKWIKQAVGNTATLMPVGTANSYTPLTITHTNGTANDTIGVNATISNAVGDATKIVNVQWSVRPSANVTATIQYQFNNSDGAAAFNVANTCELGTFTNVYQINNVGTPTENGTVYAVSLASQSLLTANTYLFVVGNISAIQCAAGTYIGVAGGDANNAANWCGGLPTSSTNVVLSANAPQLTRNLTINNLTIASGVNLALNDYQLVVNGTIAGSGTLTSGGNASLVVNNGGTLNLNQANLGTSNTLKNLTIGGGTLNIATPINITGFLYPNAGTLNVGNSDITLKSTSIAQTAQVGLVAGNISYNGTGRFVVERFINNNRRGYRNISSGGVVSDGSIFNNWQENGAQPTGYGMHITGQAGSSLGYSNSNGFDYTISGRPSLWTYSTADAFVPITNTLSPATNQLLPFVGYFAVIRGDRNYDLFSYNPSLTMASTTLRVRGKLATGAITLSSADNPSWGFSGSIASTFKLNANRTPNGKSDADFGYSLVANPYPCAINWNSVWNRSAALCNNRLSKYYWVWNQSLNGNAGGYITVDNAGITNATLNDNTLQNDHWIQPGQGFFVVNDHSAGDIVLSFDESDKWTTDNNKLKGTFDATNTTTPVYCRITLKKRAGADTLITDGAVCKFDAAYSNAIDINDAGKMTNTADNLAILKDGRALSFECRPYFADADTVAITTWNVTNSGNYLIEIDTRNMATWPVGTYLWDIWKQIKIPIYASTINQYEWQPNTDSGSFYRRFAIVYNNPITLPYQSIQLKGTVTAKGNQLQWLTSAALPEGTSMTLEESINSQASFKAVYNTIAGSNITRYAYTDTQQLTSVKYYRIRCNLVNQTRYSNTIVLKASDAEQLRIVQNLAYNHATAISIQGATATYTAVLVNASGKTVATNVLQHSPGKTVYQWPLPSSLPSGTYWVQVLRAGKQLLIEQIVVP